MSFCSSSVCFVFYFCCSQKLNEPPHSNLMELTGSGNWKVAELSVLLLPPISPNVCYYVYIVYPHCSSQSDQNREWQQKQKSMETTSSSWIWGLFNKSVTCFNNTRTQAYINLLDTFFHTVWFQIQFIIIYQVNSFGTYFGEDRRYILVFRRG